MKKNIALIVTLFVTLCMGCTSSPNKDIVQKKEVVISVDELADKIKGGWAGKTIGCTYGGPVEFLHNGTMIQDYVPIKWSRIE